MPSGWPAMTSYVAAAFEIEIKCKVCWNLKIGAGEWLIVVESLTIGETMHKVGGRMYR